MFDFLIKAFNVLPSVLVVTLIMMILVIFYECPFVVPVWSMTGMWHKIQNAIETSPSTIEAIFSLLHSLSATLSQRMAALFWSIWKHRNVKVWDDET